jgi:hypothetical protein
MKEGSTRSLASIYATMVPVVREVAVRHGYAVGVHGTMSRDLDLIAVPWVINAEPPEVLAAAVKEAIAGYDQARPHFLKNPEKKPHGRLAWSWYFTEQDAKFGTGPYLDFSVMPILTQEEKP